MIHELSTQHEETVYDECVTWHITCLSHDVARLTCAWVGPLCLLLTVRGVHDSTVGCERGCPAFREGRSLMDVRRSEVEGDMFGLISTSCRIQMGMCANL